MLIKRQSLLVWPPTLSVLDIGNFRSLLDKVKEGGRFMLSRLKVAFEITGESKRLKVFGCVKISAAENLFFLYL